MADNITVARKTIATDEVTIGSTSVHAQRVKTGFGVDGSWTEVSSTDPLPVVGNAQTSGGCTPFHYVADATDEDKTVVKSSAGQVYAISVGNLGAGDVWFKLYNQTSVPAVASDVPLFAVFAPADKSTNVSIPNGLAFGAGIAFVIVTGAANTNATEVVAAEVVVALAYK